MPKEKKPLLSDKFLTELAEEINVQYGLDELLTQKDFDAEETHSKSSRKGDE
ncbi:hypothetical protein RCG23_13830 [Neobacillus sp. PS3-34]|uniref:hypothetical protein n=1 Tax=Neobacillus sp. PS3-34 TaxID=3070678 RepID=UPI0027DF2153|nr:hypothetical protein [Neobacillus sp. PS3-34]WML46724.1 hypothetical protein RCG23_13830 [Neobacillus sp. PS3-34]